MTVERARSTRVAGMKGHLTSRWNKYSSTGLGYPTDFAY